MKKKKNWKGNCYEAAATLVMDGDDDLILVHGTPFSVALNHRIDHAWVEKQEMHEFGDHTFPLGIVIDRTVAKSQGILLAIYYHIGRMGEEHVRRYSRIETLKMMVLHKNYGPWEEEKR